MSSSQRWAEPHLCRCAPPQCRSAGRWAQRAAGASGGRGQGPRSERVSGSERLGTGLCGDDGTGSVMTSGCWVFPKGPGSTGSVYRGRETWSTSPDPPVCVCFWSFFQLLLLLLLSLQLKIFVCLFDLFSSRCPSFRFLDVYLSSPLPEQCADVFMQLQVRPEFEPSQMFPVICLKPLFSPGPSVALTGLVLHLTPRTFK